MAWVDGRQLAAATGTLDSNMPYPHSPEFRYGSHIVFAVALLAGVIGTAMPGVPFALRVASLPIAFAMVGTGFAGGWLVVHLLRLMLGWISPLLVYRFGLLYFYAPPIGAALLPLLSAFDAAGPNGQPLSWHEMLMYVPASLGVSAGARHVLNQYVAADRGR